MWILQIIYTLQSVTVSFVKHEVELENTVILNINQERGGGGGSRGGRRRSSSGGAVTVQLCRSQKAAVAKKLPGPREADQSAALFQEEKQEKKRKETMINVIGLFTLPST